MSPMAGIEPIMPTNFALDGFARHVSPSGGALPSPNPSMMNSSPFFVGRGIGSGFGGGATTHPMNSLIIRNSPYQMPMPGGASPFPMSQQMGADGPQQPIFPNGMAIDKNGMGPANAVLPSDIPMDVLVGRQITQNRLDEMGQSIVGSAAMNGRHPFPLGPFLGASDGGGGRNAPPFGAGGGAFSGDSLTRAMALQQYGQQERSMTQQNQWTMPDQFSPMAPPPSMGQSVANAETASDHQQNQNALPAFLRGAPQEQIDEFKRIIRQPNGTYGEQIRLIDALVQRMEPKRQMMYREFMRENDEREQSHRERVHKTVAQMSEKAQEQFAKISATLRNPKVPDQERWDRVLQQYEKMDPELRDEFEQKFKGFPAFSPVSH
ncbi:hypothetical protein niasHS_013197 [Heterodera schachtii]|uniref:SXP/RAL-2 family protein Ani s 5-like cation-binding domain-containing protein n=1 Tax=Heterodera schachtii TaxID=97005 RepID=A0ABD2IV53_HETSC